MQIDIGKVSLIKTLDIYSRQLEGIFTNELITYQSGFAYIDITHSPFSSKIVNNLVRQGIPFSFYPLNLSEYIEHTRYTVEGEVDVTKVLLADYVLLPHELIGLTGQELLDKVAEHTNMVKEESWDDQFDNGNLYSVRQFMEV